MIANRCKDVRDENPFPVCIDDDDRGSTLLPTAPTFAQIYPSKLIRFIMRVRHRAPGPTVLGASARR